MNPAVGSKGLITSPYVIRNCSYDRISWGGFSAHHPL
jgi:hypothetical protein